MKSPNYKIILFIFIFGFLLNSCNRSNNLPTTRSSYVDYINGGFEMVSDSMSPVHWISHWGNFTVDSIVKYSGKYSARLTPVEKGWNIPPESNIAFISLHVSPFKSKTIKLKTKIKYQFKDTAGTAFFFLQQQPQIQNITTKEFKGSSDWVEENILIKIDSTAPQMLVIGCSILGDGALWLDDMELYVDDTLITYTPRLTPLNNSEKAWLEENTFDIGGDELIKSIGDSRIVGIGEESHGSGSLRVDRASVISNLIANHGFSIVISEMSEYVDPMGSELNNYINEKGPYSSELVTSNSEIIDSLRKYNIETNKKVKFIGAETTIDYIIKALDKETRGAIHNELDTLNKIMTPVIDSYISNHAGKLYVEAKFSEKELNILNRNINQCNKWIDENVNSAEDKTEFKFMLKLVKGNLNSSNFKRDTLMADIVEHIANKYPNEKIIYTSHNAHAQMNNINKMFNYTGKHLRDRFGDDYYFLKMTFAKGKYYAYLGKHERFSDSTKTIASSDIYEINNPMLGSYEYLLGSIGKECFFLPLRGVTPNKYNNWMFLPMESLHIGAAQSFYNYRTDYLAQHCDGVIFREKSYLHAASK